ncbi:HAD family hydrolase [Metabacillus halosaccharovorans]|uniref:hypothetical protein n=1 Tax=Metabacillus halosaccharovorans TaxID=930124 RepID=UPI003734DEC6
MIERFPTIDGSYAKKKLLSVIKPLPALEELPLWSWFANIHLLSNHRIEWIKHIIRPVENSIKSITISCDVGLCKPQVGIYVVVNSKISSEGKAIFIDDQEKNLIVARNLGWNTILADDKGKWIEKVTQILVWQNTHYLN